MSPIPTNAGSKRRGGKQRQQPPSINGRKAPSTAHLESPQHLHHHHHHNNNGDIDNKESEFEDEDAEEYEEEEEDYEEEEEEDEEDEDEDEEDDEDDRRLVNGRGKAARQTPAGRRGAVVGKGGRRINGVSRDGFNLSNLAVSGE